MAVASTVPGVPSSAPAPARPAAPNTSGRSRPAACASLRRGPATASLAAPASAALRRGFAAVGGSRDSASTPPPTSAVGGSHWPAKNRRGPNSLQAGGAGMFRVDDIRKVGGCAARCACCSPAHKHSTSSRARRPLSGQPASCCALQRGRFAGRSWRLTRVAAGWAGRPLSAGSTKSRWRLHKIHSLIVKGMTKSKGGWGGGGCAVHSTAGSVACVHVPAAAPPTGLSACHDLAPDVASDAA